VSEKHNTEAEKRKEDKCDGQIGNGKGPTLLERNSPLGGAKDRGTMKKT